MFRAAVIGLGKIGLRYDIDSWKGRNIFSHSKAYLRHKGFSLVCGIDSNETNRKDFDRFTRSPAYKNCEALTEYKIDVLSLCVPTEMHKAVLAEALQYCRPKLILCEKPVAYSKKEFESISTLTREHRCEVAVNYIRRWDCGTAQVKKIIDAGKLGTVRAVHCYYTKGLLNNGSHFIDLLHYWFGIEKSVHTLSCKHTIAGHCDLDASFVLRYNGFDAVFQAGDEKDYTLIEMDIIGSKGRIRYLEGGQTIEYYRKVKDPLYGGYSALDTRRTCIHNDMQKYQYNVIQGLYSFLTGKSGLASDLGSAGRTLKTCWEVMKKCGN